MGVLLFKGEIKKISDSPESKIVLFDHRSVVLYLIERGCDHFPAIFYLLSSPKNDFTMEIYGIKTQRSPFLCGGFFFGNNIHVS